MRLTLLCNAGLAIEAENEILLVDLPNEEFEPFYRLPDQTWEEILQRQPPYEKVAGFYFTHIHPDHCDLQRLEAYRKKWPDIPVFFPHEHPAQGSIPIGTFHIDYTRMDHAPIPNPPVHVVTVVRAGGKRVYLAADSKLDCAAHRAFLKEEKMDCAVWNSMFTSRADTRKLMEDTARMNLICHMPAVRPDAFGLWKKLERNLERYPRELRNVKILDQYPAKIEF